MKIQLFYTPTSRKGMSNPDWNFPPLGILYVASYVRNIYPDIEWVISDGQMDGEDKCLKDFRTFQPDLVGVSFATPHAAGAYKFIDKLKEEAPDVLMVCGGAHPSAMPEEVLSRSYADVVVVGEGERAFAAIVEDFMKGNIWSGDKKIISLPLIENIDNIPFPARDLIDIMKYPGWIFTRGGKETDFVSSRGCPYNCWFCSNPVWKAQKPWCRFRSPKNIVDEIQFLQQKYGSNEFFDQCDEFNANVKHAVQICDEIINRGLNIRWKVQMTARTRNLSEELIEKMARSGCWMVFLGLESGNQSTLDGVGKRISLEEMKYVCRLFKKHGIKIFGLFMMFNIWENQGKLVYEDIEKSLNTIEFAKSLRKKKLLDYLSCTITTPFPGSPLWNTAMKYGLILEKDLGRWELWDSSWNQVVRLPGISTEDWIKVRAKGGKLQAYTVLASLRELSPRTLPKLMKRAKNVFGLMRGVSPRLDL